METDGCYAVNYKRQSKSNCEMTSDLSNDSEMVDDVTSDLYIMGEYILVKTKKYLNNFKLSNEHVVTFAYHTITHCNNVWK